MPAAHRTFLRQTFSAARSRRRAAWWPLALCLLLPACRLDDPSSSPDPPPAPAPSILELLEADARLSTLSTLIHKAGMAPTLRAQGPYTLLAPLDSAFAAFPLPSDDTAGADSLLTMLRYHLIEGALPARLLGPLTSVGTQLNSDLSISVHGERIMLNDATIIERDLKAGNGFVHIIDRVLVPPDEQDL